MYHVQEIKSERKKETVLINHKTSKINRLLEENGRASVREEVVKEEDWVFNWARNHTRVNLGRVCQLKGKEAEQTQVEGRSSILMVMCNTKTPEVGCAYNK